MILCFASRIHQVLDRRLPGWNVMDSYKGSTKTSYGESRGSGFHSERNVGNLGR